MFHKKNEIPGSPFRIRYGKQSHPENVRVTELPNQGYVDKPFTFKVDAKQAGSGELGVRGVGPTSGEKPKLAITDGKDRTFSVDYIPNAPGITNSTSHGEVKQSQAVRLKFLLLNLQSLSTKQQFMKRNLAWLPSLAVHWRVNSCHQNCEEKKKRESQQK